MRIADSKQAGEGICPSCGENQIYGYKLTGHLLSPFEALGNAGSNCGRYLNKLNVIILVSMDGIWRHIGNTRPPIGKSAFKPWVKWKVCTSDEFV